MFAQPETEKKTRDVYSRQTDPAIFRAIGEFPLVCSEEIATLTGRPKRQLNRRLKTFWEKGYVGKIEGGISIPNYWYLKPRKEVMAHSDGVVWWDHSLMTVGHDRGLTLIHLATRSFISGWIQQKGDDIKETVTLDTRQSFFPDARFTTWHTTHYVEYQHSAPSSNKGISDLDIKMERYNALLKDKPNAKVLFVFPERRQVESFLKRVAPDYPYLWCWATDLQSVITNPNKSVFWCPKDFERRTYSFSDVMP